MYVMIRVYWQLVFLCVPVRMKQTEPDHQATPEEGMKYDDACQREVLSHFPTD